MVCLQSVSRMTVEMNGRFYLNKSVHISSIKRLSYKDFFGPCINFPSQAFIASFSMDPSLFTLVLL